MKMSAMMLDTLRAIAEHEKMGRIGALPSLYPTRTIIALGRRDLIEPNVDGSRRLTAKGWAAIGEKAPS